LTQADLDVLGRYLRRFLVVDPAQRAVARDLLDDPWVWGGDGEKGVSLRGPTAESSRLTMFWRGIKHLVLRSIIIGSVATIAVSQLCVIL
jgi:hypothetical protein